MTTVAIKTAPGKDLLKVKGKGVARSSNVRGTVKALFDELLPLRKEHGDTVFRRTVIETAVERCDTTIGSASSAYNSVKKEYAKNTPEAIAGLGRPEGKNNGGRKKAVAAVTGQ